MVPKAPGNTNVYYTARNPGKIIACHCKAVARQRYLDRILDCSKAPVHKVLAKAVPASNTSVASFMHHFL